MSFTDLLELRDPPRAKTEEKKPEPEKLGLELDATACRICGLTAPLSDDSVCRRCYELTQNLESLGKVPKATHPDGRQRAAVEAQIAAEKNDDGRSIETALGDISAEARTNAAAKSLGSMASGELRGVGFSSSQGYIDALARGVKAATAEEYYRVLRERYDFDAFQLAALTTNIIAEDAEPASAGILHMPSDPSLSPSTEGVRGDQLPYIIAHRARKAAERAEQKTVTAVAERTRIMTGATVIAGAAAAGMGELVGWNGLGDITNKKMKQLGADNGIPADWMLDPESAKLQASRAVSLLKKKGIVISVINKGEEQEEHGEDATNFLSRWTVGRVNHRSAIGGKLGDKLLTATLENDGSLTLEGDDEMKRIVRVEYDRRKATEVHKSTDITRWLARTLRFRLGAVEYGPAWYVPAESVAMAHKICTMLSVAGWGTKWVGTLEPAPKARTCPMATTEALLDGIALGLTGEVDAELEVLEARREQIRSGGSDNATKDVGERAAATYLAKLRVLLERIVRFGDMLGDERVATLRERVRLASIEVVKQAEGSDFIQRFDIIFEELREEKAREAARETVGAQS